MCYATDTPKSGNTQGRKELQGHHYDDRLLKVLLHHSIFLVKTFYTY